MALRQPLPDGAIPALAGDRDTLTWGLQKRADPRPGDVLDYTQPYIPAITTIQINNVLAGKMAAELLLEVMSKGVRTPQILKITPRIVERGTCRRLTGRSF